MTVKILKQYPKLSGILDEGFVTILLPVRDRNENYDQYKVKGKDGKFYYEDDLLSMIGNFMFEDLFERQNP